MADELFKIKGDAPAAPDFKFWSVIGHESLSRSSWYELTVLSEKKTIAPKDVLGYAFDVIIKFQDEGQGWHERHCQGHAVRFLRVRQNGRYYEYRITLRSWFWLLTKRRNSRILQDMPVLPMLDEVFGDSPISAFKKTSPEQFTDTHNPHRYCVQFEESDHDFIARLLEEEGIYYWFNAHDAPGTMHLADTSSVAHKPLPVEAKLEYQSTDRGEVRFNQISAWIAGKRFETGKWAASDSNFKKINDDLTTKIDVSDTHELPDFEEFEFPGDYFNIGDGQIIERRRGDEIKARRERHWAITGWPDVAAGLTFKYQGDPDGSRNGEYLIGSCTFVVSHPGYEAMSDAPAGTLRATFDEMLAGDAFCHGTPDALRSIVDGTLLPAAGVRGVRLFVLGVQPKSVPYKPPRLTPRKRMPGPQSAIVVGPKGEELHVDEFGRVKVHFHWDRYDKWNEKSTCWIRVSQPWAGKGWGGYFAPRIGQEVIVDFLNGDPDRPIIMGRVYNDDKKIPYTSPTYSGFKTHSTPKGGVKNFNELRFRDDIGKEQVFIHAERRMDIRVKKNKYETVQGTSQTLIGGGHVLTVGGSLDLHAKGDVFARADGKVDFGTGGALSMMIGAAAGQHTKAAYQHNARKMTLEALTSIVLKVGSSFIEISPMGVAIVGPLIRINSGGAGPGTGPLDIDDPLDAAGADTGEPGYLDRLPRGGGGGGRRHRHSDGYHARDVVRQSDGSFTYGGSGIRVTGSPEYVDATLQTLASLDGTPTGHQLIDNLQSNGHTTTIAEDNVKAAKGGGGVCITAIPNSRPKGEEVTFPDGSKHTSDGSGADSTVHWIPGRNEAYTEPPPSGAVHHQPDEALLGHELNHADHNARGESLQGHTDPLDTHDNQEEARTIGVHGFENEPVTENNILRDMGENWRRTSHGTGAAPAPTP